MTCEPDLPGDIYLSAEMSGEEQAAAHQVARPADVPAAAADRGDRPPDPTSTHRDEGPTW